LFAQRLHADEITIQGQTRTYLQVIPNAVKPMPLVLVLHPKGHKGLDLLERSSWPAVAKQYGFIAVFPDGLNQAWADLRSPEERHLSQAQAGADDVAFLTTLVNRYIDSGLADKQRIYVSGVSNGGAMAMTLACLRPQTFAAAGSVIMSMTETMLSLCQPQTHIPMLLMLGTADPIVPYGGNPKKSKHFVSAEQTLAFWRKVNGCQDKSALTSQLPDIDLGDQSTVEKITSTCPVDTDVTFYRVNGGGHRLPDIINDAKHPDRVDMVLKPQNHDINGPEEIWQFLRRFSRP
jgi:polyhydroxybutyrate depolymerase